MDLNECKNLYRDNLLNDVIPFWVTNSQDKEYGGFYTCLDRQGKVFDTDKFIWLQCRQVWMFSVLYNQVEQKQEWIDIAIQGAEFLKKHGRDKQGNWYFSLNREGKPLIQPYNIFSDCFAAMAFGQLNKATGNKEYGEWFGYLNRQGEVLLQLKGGKWKGFFHVPRFLYQGWKTMDAIIEKQQL